MRVNISVQHVCLCGQVARCEWCVWSSICVPVSMFTPLGLHNCVLMILWWMSVAMQLIWLLISAINYLDPA